MMTTPALACMLLGAVPALGPAVGADTADRAPSRFEREVRPILEARCLSCHGVEKTSAGLDLTTLEGMLAGGEGGEPGIVPGDPDSSLVIDVIASGLMPPDPDQAPSAEELATLRDWVATGAESDLQATSGAVDDRGRDRLALEIFHLLDFRCVDCHGRHGTEGGLDLRTAASAIAGGDSGPAVVPGDPAASPMIRRLADDEMPPRIGRFDLSIKPITEPELDLIRSWIEAGAPEFPDREVLVDDESTVDEDDRSWWSFQPPREPKLPEVGRPDLVSNPIDAFLLDRLERAGLGYSPEADRRALIRRLSFDLTGLPPTPEQVDAFLTDDRPDAYERLVDAMLASPRYGERWAQPWLDAAGFVESEGSDGSDPVREQYHRFRDYVVRSINDDTPFDRFVREQLAGDELADWLGEPELSPEGEDAIVATGFLRSVVDPTDRPVHNFPPDRQQVLADTVGVVGSSLMGLTIGCARCHSHKYDPISQADYARLTAVFAAAFTPQDWLKPRERLVPLASRAEREAAEAHNDAVDGEIAPIRTRTESLEKEARSDLLDRRVGPLPEPIRADVKAALLLGADDRDAVQSYLAEKFAELGTITREELDEAFPDFKAESARLKAEIDALESEKITLPTARALVDTGPDPAPYYLQIRGDAYRRGAVAPPDVPSVFKEVAGGLDVEEPWPDAPTTGRRLAFARWLTQPGHPLTSRVFVNRAWQQVFGRGIVATVDNFGLTGSPPSHPELLDWLAVEFVRGGWSQKHLIRLLVTSRAYRQGSAVRPEAREVDPDNLLLWRMPLRRLQAEWVRDATLLAAGTMNDRMFGPSVPVEADAEGVVQAAPGGEGDRRSIYLLHRRSQPTTILELFDAPQMNPNCLERRSSIVASQALLLLNGDWLRGQAEALAGAIEAEEGRDESRRIARAYLRVLNRTPSRAESARASAFLAEQADAYRDAPPCSDGEPAAEEDIPDPSHLALTDLCHVLLNSPEFHYLD
ncbi:PSD1 and planctomycete cytochrome C domain-containing protein [Tautonia plasticadhaerens]|uniref:Planctomycete cytochrome C n=1 Tax=Tautonia plasticadhaerens TaxID=2527974 RepID=A0A518HC60_9BACT|nr:PSD1 and planctomycete cytochrome C domain-containing protein [Tautonia plasticadhaerens]QDV38448.1 Planctomycete cytochrome C [Tautonia plasticadhaerens]